MCDELRHVARPCVWPHGDKLHHTHIKERAHRRSRAAAAYPFSGLSPAMGGVHYPSRTVQRLERIDLEQLSAQAAGVEPANVLTFQRKTSHAPQEPAIQRLCASGAPGVPCPDAAYPLSGLSPAIKGGCTYAHAPGQPAAGEHNGGKRYCVYGEPPGCHISKHIEIHNLTNNQSNSQHSSRPRATAHRRAASYTSTICRSVQSGCSCSME